MIYDIKLPTINPETISMLGLNLFSQLCAVRILTSVFIFLVQHD